MIAQTMRTNLKRRIACALALGIVSMSLVIGSTYGDQQLPLMTVGYQSGTITAIYETNFQIDHRTYSLTPDAVLLDRHDDELNASHLRTDIEVKYHLQKDSKDKIDRMILILPE